MTRGEALSVVVEAAIEGSNFILDTNAEWDANEDVVRLKNALETLGCFIEMKEGRLKIVAFGEEFE